MTEDPAGAPDSPATERSVEPPPLPQALLDPRPVLLVVTLAWATAAVAAFTLSSAETWRPVTVAGLGLAVFGTFLFLWQRSAARRGSRGAQTGLR